MKTILAIIIALFISFIFPANAQTNHPPDNQLQPTTIQNLDTVKNPTTIQNLDTVKNPNSEVDSKRDEINKNGKPKKSQNYQPDKEKIFEEYLEARKNLKLA